MGYIYQLSLAGYILLLIAELIRPGFASVHGSVHLLLIVCFGFGWLYVRSTEKPYRLFSVINHILLSGFLLLAAKALFAGTIASWPVLGFLAVLTLWVAVWFGAWHDESTYE